MWLFGLARRSAAGVQRELGVRRQQPAVEGEHLCAQELSSGDEHGIVHRVVVAQRQPHCGPPETLGGQHALDQRLPVVERSQERGDTGLETAGPLPHDVAVLREEEVRDHHLVHRRERLPRRLAVLLGAEDGVRDHVGIDDHAWSAPAGLDPGVDLVPAHLRQLAPALPDGTEHLVAGGVARRERLQELLLERAAVRGRGRLDARQQVVGEPSDGHRSHSGHQSQDTAMTCTVQALCM